MMRPIGHDPEFPIIEAIRAGDPEAFRQFVARYDRRVRGVIFAALGRVDQVDDVAQQVWTAVWEKIGGIRNPASWRSWLFRLARNAAVDAGRSDTRHRNGLRKVVGLTPCDVQQGTSDSSGSAVAALVRKEVGSETMRAIESLPALYREPFVLRHLNDWGYDEIGEVMNLPVDTVETRLVRARRMLRESLGHLLDRA